MFHIYLKTISSPSIPVSVLSLLFSRYKRNCRERNPRTRIIKSAKHQCRILEPEKTFSTSSPFIRSLFTVYLQQEAINVLLKNIETQVGTFALDSNLLLCYFVSYGLWLCSSDPIKKVKLKDGEMKVQYRRNTFCVKYN